ncbi:cytochrome c551 [Bacillus sp. DJP31]|uniref:cytochrome c551 n=1 Tax=Bacillus sp. DJP31 TaxID=3409789 RepID=UPI003BB4DFAE
MKRKLMVILFGTTLALSACGGGDDATTQEENSGGESAGAGTTEVSAGEALYQKSCSSCHGGNLEGNFGPSLKKVGTKYAEEEILGIIHNGQGGMPKGLLQGEDAKAVAAWLATMK